MCDNTWMAQTKGAPAPPVACVKHKNPKESREMWQSSTEQQSNESSSNGLAFVRKYYPNVRNDPHLDGIKSAVIKEWSIVNRI